MSEKRVVGQVMAQLFGSLLDPKFSFTGQEVSFQDIYLTKAFVIHIQRTKVYIYHGDFSTKFLEEIQSGKKVTETATIHRYPKDGFDLGDAQQRKDLFLAMFKVLKYCTSQQAKSTTLSRLTNQLKVLYCYFRLIAGYFN